MQGSLNLAAVFKASKREKAKRTRLCRVANNPAGRSVTQSKWKKKGYKGRVFPESPAPLSCWSSQVAATLMLTCTTSQPQSPRQWKGRNEMDAELQTIEHVNVRFLGSIVVPARVGLGRIRESGWVTLSLPDQSQAGGLPKCGCSDCVLTTCKTNSAE